jgi:hypothetical protein
MAPSALAKFSPLIVSGAILGAAGLWSLHTNSPVAPPEAQNFVTILGTDNDDAHPLIMRVADIDRAISVTHNPQFKLALKLAGAIAANHRTIPNGACQDDAVLAQDGFRSGVSILKEGASYSVLADYRCAATLAQQVAKNESDSDVKLTASICADEKNANCPTASALSFSAVINGAGPSGNAELDFRSRDDIQKMIQAGYAPPMLSNRLSADNQEAAADVIAMAETMFKIAPDLAKEFDLAGAAIVPSRSAGAEIQPGIDRLSRAIAAHFQPEPYRQGDAVIQYGLTRDPS